MDLPYSFLNESEVHYFMARLEEFVLFSHERCRMWFLKITKRETDFEEAVRTLSLCSGKLVRYSFYGLTYIINSYRNILNSRNFEIMLTAEVEN